jgi:hypothetical protein
LKGGRPIIIFYEEIETEMTAPEVHGINDDHGSMCLVLNYKSKFSSSGLLTGKQFIQNTGFKRFFIWYK